MNNFERFLADKLLEGAGKGEQRGRAHLKDIPSERTTRHQGFGLGTGPHGGHDAGEGSEQDVKRQENIARLEAALKKPKLTGIQRAQIQSYYDRLKGSKKTGGKWMDRPEGSSRTMQQSEGKVWDTLKGLFRAPSDEPKRRQVVQHGAMSPERQARLDKELAGAKTPEQVAADKKRRRRHMSTNEGKAWPPGEGPNRPSLGPVKRPDRPKPDTGTSKPKPGEKGPDWAMTGPNAPKPKPKPEPLGGPKDPKPKPGDRTPPRGLDRKRKLLQWKKQGKLR